MNGVVVRATIETSTFFNEGFIHMKNGEIEGIFTLDYVQIFLDGKNMILNLTERSFIFRKNLYRSTTNYNKYQCSFPYNDLYIPDTYHLYDESNNLLTFCIESIIHDSEEKLRIINSINKNKY